MVIAFLYALDTEIILGCCIIPVLLRKLERTPRTTKSMRVSILGKNSETNVCKLTALLWGKCIITNSRRE